MVSWLFLDIKNTLHVYVQTLSQSVSSLQANSWHSNVRIAILSYCRIGLIFLFFLYPLGSTIYQLLTFLSCETEQQLPTEFKLEFNSISYWVKVGFLAEVSQNLFKILGWCNFFCHSILYRVTKKKGGLRISIFKNLWRPQFLFDFDVLTCNQKLRVSSKQ